MTKPVLAYKNGFTLTEVVVASALLAISIGGIISVLVASVDITKSTDYLYASSNIAKNRIERIREIRNEGGYNSLAQTAEDSVIVDHNGIPDPNGDFVRTTTINPAYGLYHNLTMITVEVKYRSKGVLIAQSVQAVTLLSPYY